MQSRASLHTSCLRTKECLPSTSRCRTFRDFSPIVFKSCRSANVLKQNGFQFEVAVRVAAPEKELGNGEVLPLKNDDGGGVYDCVVVGAGISGLVTAQALLKDHKDKVSR